MTADSRIENKLDSLESRMAGLTRTIATLDTTVRSEQHITEKHDGLLRKLSELVVTLNLSIKSLEKSVNGLPVKVAEQGRDLERLSARVETLTRDLGKSTAAEITGRYGVSRAWIGLLGTIAGGAMVWLLKN